MIIIGRKCGQLANRLISFSNFIGNAIEHGYSLVNPCFREYRDYFESTASNRFGDYPIWVKRHGLHRLDWALHTKVVNPVLRTLRRLHTLDAVLLQTEEFCDLGSESFVARARSQRLLIAKGWLFRDFKNVKKHGDLIRQFFRPVAPFGENATEALDRVRQQADVVVGVHIRRGDYETWKGGMHFYSLEEYGRKMQEMNDLLAEPGRKVRFLVCSNESIPPDVWRPYQVDVDPGPGHMIEDLYALSKCDWLIGPPSTYTTWASFYGQTPLIRLKTADQELSLEDSRRAYC